MLALIFGLHGAAYFRGKHLQPLWGKLLSNMKKVETDRGMIVRRIICLLLVLTAVGLAGIYGVPGPLHGQKCDSISRQFLFQLQPRC